ncbi:conserved Plasmodium protein, unknown function [Plasmodium chabaudi chabaudi]|uniref:Uncharacterized protein n=1 Tax=Plasmodium chabaudi chabaudi TaxID=31271 RepID=A0A4V0K5Q7_PLACU|nr:conserved Plasmodium protein, unknown function [Plasmodium chabaudi chabaudi]VTZ67928.1 conserved Plasmodium protein, unknown function [Plasmodium chabaudi chabaudi]|eukprot:XP_740135.2 conserved Plasmodium protein, unknown function [Plasmodium chabaudi chabaudi]
MNELKEERKDERGEIEENQMNKIKNMLIDLDLLIDISKIVLYKNENFDLNLINNVNDKFVEKICNLLVNQKRNVIPEDELINFIFLLINDKDARKNERRYEKNIDDWKIFKDIDDGCSTKNEVKHLIKKINRFYFYFKDFIFKDNFLYKKTNGEIDTNDNDKKIDNSYFDDDLRGLLYNMDENSDDLNLMNGLVKAGKLKYTKKTESPIRKIIHNSASENENEEYGLKCLKESERFINNLNESNNEWAFSNSANKNYRNIKDVYNNSKKNQEEKIFKNDTILSNENKFKMDRYIKNCKQIEKNDLYNNTHLETSYIYEENKNYYPTINFDDTLTNEYYDEAEKGIANRIDKDSGIPKFAKKNGDHYDSEIGSESAHFVKKYDKIIGNDEKKQNEQINKARNMRGLNNAKRSISMPSSRIKCIKKNIEEKYTKCEKLNNENSESEFNYYDNTMVSLSDSFFTFSKGKKNKNILKKYSNNKTYTLTLNIPSTRNNLKFVHKNGKSQIEEENEGRRIKVSAGIFLEHSSEIFSKPDNIFDFYKIKNKFNQNNYYKENFENNYEIQNDMSILKNSGNESNNSVNYEQFEISNHFNKGKEIMNESGNIGQNEKKYFKISNYNTNAENQFLGDHPIKHYEDNHNVLEVIKNSYNKIFNVKNVRNPKKEESDDFEKNEDKNMTCSYDKYAENSFYEHFYDHVNKNMTYDEFDNNPYIKKNDKSEYDNTINKGYKRESETYYTTDNEMLNYFDNKNEDNTHFLFSDINKENVNTSRFDKSYEQEMKHDVVENKNTYKFDDNVDYYKNIMNKMESKDNDDIFNRKDETAFNKKSFILLKSKKEKDTRLEKWLNKINSRENERKKRVEEKQKQSNKKELVNCTFHPILNQNSIKKTKIKNKINIYDPGISLIEKKDNIQHCSSGINKISRYYNLRQLDSVDKKRNISINTDNIIYENEKCMNFVDRESEQNRYNSDKCVQEKKNKIAIKNNNKHSGNYNNKINKHVINRNELLYWKAMKGKEKLEKRRAKLEKEKEEEFKKEHNFHPMINENVKLFLSEHPRGYNKTVDRIKKGVEDQKRVHDFLSYRNPYHNLMKENDDRKTIMGKKTTRVSPFSFDQGFYKVKIKPIYFETKIKISEHKIASLSICEDEDPLYIVDIFCKVHAIKDEDKKVLYEYILDELSKAKLND